MLRDSALWFLKVNEIQCCENSLRLHIVLHNDNIVHRTFAERTLLKPKFVHDPKPCFFSLDFLIFSSVIEESQYMLFSLVQWQRRGNLSNDTELLLFLCISIQNNSTAYPQIPAVLSYLLFVHKRQFSCILFHGNDFKQFWLSQHWQRQLKNIRLTIFSGVLQSVHKEHMDLMGQ